MWLLYFFFNLWKIFVDLIIDKFDFYRGWVLFIIGFNFLFYLVFVYLLYCGGYLIFRYKSKLKLILFFYVIFLNWLLVFKFD